MKVGGLRLDGPVVSKSLYISSGRGRHQPQLPNDRSTEEWIRTERQLLNVIVINLFSLIYESTLLCLPLCYWNWTQFSSVAQSCPTLCYPMDSSTPVFPVLHHLPELAQTHVHWVGDAIQPSRPLSSPSPPAFNLSWHQGLFQWVCSLHWVAKGLELQPQDQSFQWIFRIDLLAVQGTIHLGLPVNPLLASDIQGPFLCSFLD